MTGGAQVFAGGASALDGGTTALNREYQKAALPDDELTAPPSGNRMPNFYIDGTMTGGTVSASPSIPVRTPPVSSNEYYTPSSVAPITLTATPAEGYVLKDWEVLAVNPSSGEPLSQGYSLPVDYVDGQYVLTYGQYNSNLYVFRIRAIFEEGKQPVTLQLEAYDKSGIKNTGSTLTVNNEEGSGPYYAGDTVTVTANLVEGATFSTYTVSETHQEKSYPSIYYYSREENLYGTNTQYIDPVWNGNTFSFTVPDDIDPNDAKIYVTAAFEDASYSVSVPENQDEKIGTVVADKTAAAKGDTVTLTATVAGNVGFVPESGVIVSYTDGNNQVATVPVTRTETHDYETLIEYTYTFTMPAHDVSVSAVFGQKDYLITWADLTNVSPKPQTTMTVDGFLVSSAHVYARANEGDPVELSVVAENGADNTKQAVRGIYYTLDSDLTGTHYDLELTIDEFQNPSTSFTMPAGNITLHYVVETAYEVIFDAENAYGTISVDKRYAFEGETVTITGSPDNSVYQHDRLNCPVRFGTGEVDVTVTENDGTFTATFTMPQGKVVVTPEFQMEAVSYDECRWDESTFAVIKERKTIVRYFTVDANTTELLDGDYVVKGTVETDKYIYVKKGCTANLIVPSGNTLKCHQGIGCGYNKKGEYATLNIFGDGKIEANASEGRRYAAGIGGDDNETNGNIRIHGTEIHARGGYHGAGIGGGAAGKDPDGTTSIIIYSAIVYADGGDEAAGIGGGNEQPGAHTYIYSGRITATGGKLGAGIGGGDEEGTLGIFIYGGSITARGGKHAAGIGAGEEGGNMRKLKDGGGVNFYGGSIDAYGGDGGAGVGGGYGEDMSGEINFLFVGNTGLYAYGGESAAGIGAGSASRLGKNGDMNGTITIDASSGSVVRAFGGTGEEEKYDEYTQKSWTETNYGGAGIGAGYGGNFDGKFIMKGGNVSAKGGFKAAGIGGGQEYGDFCSGGEGGSVTIEGGFLIACAGDGGKAEAIGAGSNDYVSGSVHLADDLCVVWEPDRDMEGGQYPNYWAFSSHNGKIEKIKYSKRTSKCHSSGSVAIHPCDHKKVNTADLDLTYTFDETTHTAKCKYCSYKETKNHTFDANGVCTECGYERGCTYVFFNSDGGTDVENQKVVKGETTTPPAEPTKEGFTFGGWYKVTNITTGAVASTPFDFENTPINGFVYLKAKWVHVHDGITFETWDSGDSLPTTPGNYVLAQDVTLTHAWTWQSGTLNLCLNGHTLACGDSSATTFLEVAGGTVNLYDEGDGIITQTGSAANVPALVIVQSGGTFTMHGGDIQESANNGVNVYGTFIMDGGSVTGNGGYGVYVKSNASITVSGDIRVTENVQGDVYLENGSLIHVADVLNDSRIGVAMEQPGVFTSGLSGKGAAENFISNDSTYKVELNTDDEAYLGEPVTAIIKSASVEFEGQLRLAFTFSFPAEVLADEGAYLTFEKAGTTTTQLVSEGTPRGEDVVFHFSVAAPEYADDITIKVYDGNGNQLTLKSSHGTDYTEDGFVYSLKTYAEHMIQNGSTEEMRNLAKALDDYCTAAQIYFKYGDYSGLSVDNAVTDVTLGDLESFALTTSGTKPAGVTKASISVRFDSDNALRITFYTESDTPLKDYTFLLDGNEVENPIVSGKNVKVLVDDIAAPNLAVPHTFAITDGTDTYTITASALSYAYSLAKNSDTTRQNLGKALYLYYLAAHAKFVSGT
ncbi:MAG: InlB B-repeat-containing protein [Clostridiales bacterium]|nr:InlB B-repeat-containing protein [Clostridiales bacterium]